MKKLIAVFLGLAFVLPMLPAQAATGQEALSVPEGVTSFDWDFLTSAYYSPKEGQDYYLQGDYESEKVLNGNGTNGASGVEVFFGMIAAPSNLPFGTKIYIPGIGLGEVQDRGGAINNSRIDIWMGEGDEGLARALTWGKRTKHCTVYLPGAEIPEAIANKDFRDSYLFLDVELPADTASRLEASASGTRSLQKGYRGTDVQELQQNLKDLGYLEIDSTTTYFGSQTEAAVIAFQIANGVITSADSAGAGIYGPQTSAKMDEILNGTVVASLDDEIITESGDGENADNTVVSTSAEFTFDEALTLGSQGDAVTELQTALAELGYFTGETSDYYGLQTAEAVYLFQKQNLLVGDKSSLGAGVFGPKTQTALAAAITNDEKRAQDEIVLGTAVAAEG